MLQFKKIILSLIKYYVFKIDKDCPPWGKHWLYRFTQPPKGLLNQYLTLISPICRFESSFNKYYVHLFNRDIQKWIEVGTYNTIPKGFKLLTKKELFLELL